MLIIIGIYALIIGMLIMWNKEKNWYVNDQLVGVQVMLRAFLCTLAIVLIALRPTLAGYHRVP